MFTNENACTIWEKTIQDHMEVYVPHVFYDVYCQTTTAQTVQNTSREPNDGYLFIIHQSKIPYMPKKMIKSYWERFLKIFHKKRLSLSQKCGTSCSVHGMSDISKSLQNSNNFKWETLRLRA